MDEDLRALEREHEAAPTAASLDRWARALVRAGRAGEIPGLVLAPGAPDLVALGATAFGLARHGPLELEGYRLPAALGDHVFLRVPDGRVWIAAKDELSFQRISFAGWDDPHEGEDVATVEHRRGGGAPTLLFSGEWGSREPGLSGFLAGIATLLGEVARQSGCRLTR